MSRKLSGWLAVGIALGCLGLFLWGLVGPAGAASDRIVISSNQASSTPVPYPDDSARRESDGASFPNADPLAPLISFIDSPSATCYLPVPHTNACYIQWQYLNVTASTSQYIISMTLSISNEIRAYYSGFFQTTMYIPGDMQSPGFRVACGLPGASGDPVLGQSYSYKVQARETGGLKAANYGSVFCPSDVVPVVNAQLTGPTNGFIQKPYNYSVSVPVTTTLPVTYTWTVTGQAPRVISGAVSNQQSYTWNPPGIKSISVEVANRAGSIYVTGSVNITEIKLYLPIVRH